MMEVKLLEAWSGHPHGARVGVDDAIAANLIGQGIAADPNPAPEAPAAKAKPKAAKKKAKAKAKKKSKK